MNRFVTLVVAVFLLGFSVVGATGDKREDIHASAQEVQPLLIGMRAPAFTVRDVENMTFEFKPGT
ncbi:MAG: hypothetical protein WBM36_10325, partial [Lysobacterales bacterium]